MKTISIQGSNKVYTLLSRKEAAARLGVSLVTLDAERNAGYLAYIQRKSGGKVWITQDAIVEYLEKATHPVKPAMRFVGETYRKRRGDDNRG